MKTNAHLQVIVDVVSANKISATAIGDRMWLPQPTITRVLRSAGEVNGVFLMQIHAVVKGLVAEKRARHLRVAERQERDREHSKLVNTARTAAAREDRRSRVAELKAFKANARRLYSAALRRGEVMRPSVCECCLGDCIPHGHHEDYSRPLDVVWLCKWCHRAKHSYDPSDFEEYQQMMREPGKPVAIKFRIRKALRQCPVSQGEIVSEKVRAALKHYRVTQQELATELGMRRPTLSDAIGQGRIQPDDEWTEAVVEKIRAIAARR